MAAKTTSYDEALLRSLSDPDEAMHYLDAARQDSPESFLKAQEKVAEATAKKEEAE